MKLSNLLWGLVLVVLGVIFGLNALGITDINIFFSGWWTLFIIVPCFIDLFKDDDKTGNVIGLVIGVSLLLACQGVLSFGLIAKMIVPVVLVLIGLSLIFKDTIKGKVRKEIKKLNKNNPTSKEYCATFGGVNLDFSNEDFDGANLTAVFGGVKCDFSGSNIKGDIVVNAQAIFGGVTIIVPDDVEVKISSTPIFGGVSDNRGKRKGQKETKAVVYVNATCMFGGVEIK